MTFFHPIQSTRGASPTRNKKARRVAVALGLGLAVALAASGAVPAEADIPQSDTSPAASSSTAAVSGQDAVADDGAEAVRQLVADDLPAEAQKLIDPTDGTDAGIAVSRGVVTALPDVGDTSIETASATSGEVLSMSIEGLSAPKPAGSAVVAANGDESDVMVQATAKGVQIVQVAQTPEAANNLSVATDAPDGFRWVPVENGGLQLVGQDADPVAFIESPWALDANGRELPTTFTLENGVISQHVDTRGATFPVSHPSNCRSPGRPR